MNLIVRVALTVVVGVLVTSLLEWLTALPHTIDVLLGVVAALLVYFNTPTVPVA